MLLLIPSYKKQDLEFAIFLRNGKREFNKHEIEFISKRYNFDADLTMKVFF